MQRLLNNPADYVDEMLQGIYAAHPSQVKCINDDLKKYICMPCETSFFFQAQL